MIPEQCPNCGNNLEQLDNVFRGKRINAPELLEFDITCPCGQDLHIDVELVPIFRISIQR